MGQIIPIDLVSGSYESISENMNSQRTINLYLEEDENGGKYDKMLVPMPGTVLFATKSGGSSVRGMISHKEVH